MDLCCPIIASILPIISSSFCFCASLGWWFIFFIIDIVSLSISIISWPICWCSAIMEPIMPSCLIIFSSFFSAMAVLEKSVRARSADNTNPVIFIAGSSVFKGLKGVMCSTIPEYRKYFFLRPGFACGLLRA